MPATWQKLAFDADKISHSLATAANDFLVASGAGVFVKKTLAETKTILGNPFQPFAYPISFSPTAPFTGVYNLAADGFSLAVPILLTGRMNLQSVSIWSGDTSLERIWGWDLYNDATGASNSLGRVAACTANETFTPSAASLRTLDAGSAPVLLNPGPYWLVIQNRSAARVFGLGYTASSANFAVNTSQRKQTTNPNGATLDFVEATWDKGINAWPVRLNGRSFGDTVAF